LTFFATLTSIKVIVPSLYDGTTYEGSLRFPANTIKRHDYHVKLFVFRLEAPVDLSSLLDLVMEFVALKNQLGKVISLPDLDTIFGSID
jgi:hypothetical protein